MASAIGWPVASPLAARSIASRHHCRRMAPRRRLAHLLRHAGKLGIEGIEGEEIGAAPARGEQSGDAPVGIGLARDASYGLALLAAHQGQLASAKIRRAPARIPSPWRRQAPR